MISCDFVRFGDCPGLCRILQDFSVLASRSQKFQDSECCMFSMVLVDLRDRARLFRMLHILQDANGFCWMLQGVVNFTQCCTILRLVACTTPHLYSQMRGVLVLMPVSRNPSRRALVKVSCA